MPDELLVLGSASGVPTRYRFASAYALVVTGKLFLIDCGAPVSTLLYRYGLDPTDVQAVFLSHWHMDHVANLGLLLTQNHQYKRAKTLHIYGPKGTRGKIKRLLADSFLMPEDLSYTLKLTNLNPGQNCKEALLRVAYFKTQHLEQPKLKSQFDDKAVACGMVISGPGWRIVYSGDSASPEELSPYVKDCDLLIHEMAHHSPEAVAQFATKANIPNLLVSHIGLEYDEAPQKIIAAFANHYNGNLLIAEDGIRLRLRELDQTGQHAAIPAERSNKIDPLAQSLLSVKQVSPDQAQEVAFLQLLHTELSLPRHISQEIAHQARKMLASQPAALIQPGQIRLTVARQDAPLGIALTAADKVQVTLTLAARLDDDEVKTREGVAGLRRGKILRLTEEAFEQNGLLTQEDLANILTVDVRTIRRDMRVLQNEGHIIYTRSQTNSENIEPIKTRSIKLWLDRQNYEQIAHWRHHSTRAVESQIMQFLQVIEFQQEGVPAQEIADLVGLSTSLVQDYLALYEVATTLPHQRDRLNNALAQRKEVK